MARRSVWVVEDAYGGLPWKVNRAFEKYREALSAKWKAQEAYPTTLFRIVRYDAAR